MFLASITDPTLGFITQDEITVSCRHVTLMMRAITSAGYIRGRLRRQS
jgi:hypothetical protein